MKRRRRKAPEIVAFQGERGAFSEEAARKLLGRDIEVRGCQSFEDVFHSLASRQVAAAVIPIENTLHGSVHENYDHLLQFHLPIVAETSIRIVHHLMAPPGVRFSQIRQVYSHPVALNQCLKFFSDHPRMQKMVFYDTAGSAKMVMKDRPEGGGAIASAMAAATYGTHILRRSIEDDRQNFTRFFLLRRPGSVPPMPRAAGSRSSWKTSLVFSTRNVPGSLFRSMAAFALRDLDLTKMESRPMRGKPWEYMFYLDFIGRVDSQVCRKALEHLGEVADFVRVLGCYPRGDGA